MSNNRNTRTLGHELMKKESKKIKYKRLQNYQWGIGLEHEMQIFHKPSHNLSKNIDSFIMFNSKSRIEELLKGDNITVLDKEFLSEIPFEPTGRKCAGKIVLKKTPIAMPEFITEKPFSNLKKGKRPIESYCVEIKEKENRFFTLLHLNEKTIKTEGKIWTVRTIPLRCLQLF